VTTDPESDHEQVTGEDQPRVPAREPRRADVAL